MTNAGGQINALLPAAVNALRHAAIILTTVCLAFVSSKLAWLTIAGPQFMASLPAAQNSRAGQTIASVDTSVLQSATPFKTTPSLELQDYPEFNEETPETDLNLTLNGVRTDGDGEGVAFITGADGIQTRYNRGDDINHVQSVSVDQIYADGVILSRNGRIEKLTTQDENVDRAIKPAEDSELLRNSILKQPQTTKNRPFSRQANARSKQKSSDQEQLIEAHGSEVRSQSAKLSKNEMRSFMQWARLDAQTVDNVPGVTVFPTNSAIFKKSGLRSRDVIQSIAGISLAENVDYARLLEDLEAEEQVNIRLLRNGAEIDLTIRMVGE